jgi:hypothetical protein
MQLLRKRKEISSFWAFQLEKEAPGTCGARQGSSMGCSTWPAYTSSACQALHVRSALSEHALLPPAHCQLPALSSHQEGPWHDPPNFVNHLFHPVQN